MCCDEQTHEDPRRRLTQGGAATHPRAADTRCKPKAKPMNIKLAGTLIILATFLSPVMTLAADSSTDTAGEFLDDATITVRVKAAFAKDDLVKGHEISVRTDHGVVDLTGKVSSKAESDRATKVATAIKSVTAVHNNLKVDAR